MYKNRLEAGQILAHELMIFKNDHPVILALPRGGIPIAAPIVKQLNTDFDIIIPRKIGAPYNEEVAIGSVTEEGHAILNQSLIERLAVPDSYIEQATLKQVQEIKRRLNTYRQGRAPIKLEGRVVILVDDGIATGYTMHAAIQSVQHQNPKKLIIAVPVAPPETVDTLTELIDAVVCPLQVIHFQAVGQFYDEFNQVSDEEVSELLKIIV
ncbi:phosphoribosyltransferase [Desulfuribacillus alkaliarsenatis]|uniref:Phosphoribosyltransferase n=1 Tax=Desulfuribacillus alkaliarsenatis TaxID=766136 RepID=A0A1E5G6D6_9FIRM|nr:phosphoribosyltransferase [Desulfuribacillus alkaliarsenatis]